MDPKINFPKFSVNLLIKGFPRKLVQRAYRHMDVYTTTADFKGTHTKLFVSI